MVKRALLVGLVIVLALPAVAKEEVLYCSDAKTSGIVWEKSAARTSRFVLAGC